MYNIFRILIGVPDIIRVNGSVKVRGHVPAWRLMLVYSITEGFSPILCCRPDVITLGNPFDTRVPDYSSSSFFVSFSKNEEEAIPPGGKIYLGTIKARGKEKNI